jgi:hypothetical protein
MFPLLRGGDGDRNGGEGGFARVLGRFRGSGQALQTTVTAMGY